VTVLGFPLLRVLDLTGVFVFAVSGALAAGRKRLDLFGVCVIAVVTAIGGGTLRDLLLGRLPVFWVSDPLQLPVILAATAATLLYTRAYQPPVKFLLVADALGLALFAVSGAQIAESVTHQAVVVVLMGALSCTAGGVVRDVLCNEIPLILQGGNLYATAALGGAAVYVLAHALGGSPSLATGAGMATVLALRLAAIFFGIRLPIYELAERQE
jgi:uncharacterized membrane protein YeiH